MGYNHYFWRTPELDRDAFVHAVADVRLVLEALRKRGVQLAGPEGHGEPELNDFIIAFNGKKECGHRYIDLGDPYPSETAEGIEAVLEPVVGPYVTGARLATRVCGGSCAGKPFIIDRKFSIRSWSQLEHGGYHGYCDTAYKPYDMAVTSALVRLKERLRDEFKISSDGHERGFSEAKQLCRELFGWASHFEMESEGSEVV